MRALSVTPIAVGVATALLAACGSGGAPTSPDPAQAAPSFARSEYQFHDEVAGSGCARWPTFNYTNISLLPLAYQDQANKADRNGNGVVCAKFRG